jgi:arabinofuranosyltransferase
LHTKEDGLGSGEVNPVTLEPILTELLQRFIDEFKTMGLLWLMLAWVATMLCLPNIRQLPSRLRNGLNRVLLLITIVGATMWAWSLLWASDDAYISFRYADNLAHGHGLVYNPGERVEGYTDFLWTVIAALVIRLKGDPGQVTIIINLLSFVGLILLVERLGRRLCAAPVVIGVAALLIAANYTMASFATACIETMFAAMLVTLALERVDSGHALAGGVAGVAAAMTHPDHGIFYAALALALLMDRTRRRDLLYFALPFVVIFVPYFVWRWRYYGDLMPNTFYAKSADRVYFEQGIKYLLVTVVGAGFWLSAPLGVLGAYRARRSLIGRYAIILIPLYLVYVAKVGGDFMLGRFFVPAIPVWLLLVDAGYRWLISRNHWRTAITLLLPATGIALPISVVKSGELYHGIADERSWVNVKSFATMEVNAFGYVLGRTLHDQFVARGHTPRMAIWCIGMAGYYSKLPIFDMRGLSSRSVAHLPIARRGRPGHEKVASAGLVVESDSDLSEIPVYPMPYARLTPVNVGGGHFNLVRYDPKVLAALPRGTGVQSFAAYIDTQLSALANKPAHVLACDLWQMREYYFSRNSDESRRVQVTHAAVQGDPTLRGLESLLLQTRDLAQLGYKVVRRFGFDSTEAPWQVTGDAGQWLTEGLRAEQEYPFGRVGRYLNTFLPPDDDAGTGRMISPEFVIKGDVVSLFIAGGQGADTEHIQLLVEGRPVRNATGCDTDWLGRRLWNVAEFKGKTARYSVEDGSSGAWGHIVIDEVIEWQSP